jgi:hypothetical protein
MNLSLATELTFWGPFWLAFLLLKAGIVRGQIMMKLRRLLCVLASFTQFWIRLVHHVIQTNPQIRIFPEFFDSFPPIRDSKSIFRHYTKDFLMSESACAEWRDPDLLILE